MKNTAIFSVLLILASILTVQTHAETTVNVSGNGDSEVSVHSSVNSSNTNTSTSNSHTTIHMETNGKVQDYDSDNPGNVHMQSDDGNTTVNVTTNTGNNTIVISSAPKHQISPTNNPSLTPTAAIDKQKSHENKKMNMYKQQENFLLKMQALLKKFFPFRLFF
jgi:hypothetical protein